MKKVEKFVCPICHEKHDNETAAKKCESRGFTVPYFKIGDMVTYQVDLGSDRDGPYYGKRTGMVIDILFPVPPEYSGTGHTLKHTYRVSYLVRVTERESESSDQFFDQEHIDLLQTVKTVEVVSEANMFFEDGSYIEGLSPNPLRSRRTVVTSWYDYVAEIKRRNPQLRTRLARFTVEIRRLGCLG